MNKERVTMLISSVFLLVGIILGFFLARQTRYAEINRGRFRSGACGTVTGTFRCTVESLLRANAAATELLHFRFPESEVRVAVVPVSENMVRIFYFTDVMETETYFPSKFLSEISECVQKEISGEDAKKDGAPSK